MSTSQHTAIGSHMKKEPASMKLKLTLKFDGAEREALIQFQETINSQGPVLSLEQLAKQAIFYSINDAYRRGREEVARLDALAELQSAQQVEAVNGDAGSGDIEGNNAETSGSEVANIEMEATQDSGDTSPSAT